MTNFPAPPGCGGTFLDVTWAFIKFFDDYPDARGGNEFLTLIFNLHAMTKDLTSLGLPTGAAEAGRDDDSWERRSGRSNGVVMRVSTEH